MTIQAPVRAKKGSTPVLFHCCPELWGKCEVFCHLDLGVVASDKRSGGWTRIKHIFSSHLAEVKLWREKILGGEFFTFHNQTHFDSLARTTWPLTKHTLSTLHCWSSIFAFRTPRKAEPIYHLPRRWTKSAEIGFVAIFGLKNCPISCCALRRGKSQREMELSVKL